MKNLSVLLAVFLVLVMVFGLSFSVFATLVEDHIGKGDGEDDDTVVTPDPDPDPDPDPEPPTKVKGNNGFGNGDQDAPGNSGENNNAENATPPRNYPGKSGH